MYNGALVGVEEDRRKGWRWVALAAWFIVAFIVIPVICFSVDWTLGFVLALLAPLPLFFILPRKGYRLLAVLWVVYVVALWVGTWLQAQMSGDTPWRAAIERSPILTFLAGSYEMQVVWSLLAGLVAGVLLAGVFLVPPIWMSAESMVALTELEGVSRWEAMKLVASAVLNVGQAWLVIDEGKEKVSKPEGVLRKYGGPGVVVILEGNAVVFQKGGKVTQIVGAGAVRTRFLERIFRIVDLTPQWENRTLENVRTRDHIPLTVELGVGYRIEPKEETDKRPEAHQAPDGEARTNVLKGECPVYEGVVRNAVFKPSGNWRLTAMGMVESNLRDVIATYDFNQIFSHYPETRAPGTEGKGEKLSKPLDPDERVVHAIEKQVAERVRPNAVRMGISIGTVDIRAVVVPEEVQERLLEWWGTAWQTGIRVALGEAERQVLALKGAGQAAALEAVEAKKQEAMEQTFRMLEALTRGVARQDTELARRLVTAMEHLMGRVIVEDVLALRMLEALEKFSEGKGDLTVFLGGREIPFLAPPGEGEQDSR